MQKVNAKLNIFNNLYKFFIQTKIIEKEKKLKRENIENLSLSYIKSKEFF